MAPLARGNCRTVAPLIARYNDPDLGEVERVLLSTHLLRCERCLARLQEYRALDQRLRRMPAVVLSARAREAVLERIAAPAPGVGGLLALGPAWRQSWAGAATAISLAALVLALSLTTFRAAQVGNGTTTPVGTANDVFVRPLTATILSANPTEVVSSVGQSLGGTTAIDGTRSGHSAAALATVATVREIHPREGRIVVLVEGARSEERLIIARDVVVLWDDGRQGTLADIAAGATIQLRRDPTSSGGLVVRQIILSR
jgi:hypothetical protein